jgi:hypothetical protein
LFKLTLYPISIKNSAVTDFTPHNAVSPLPVAAPDSPAEGVSIHRGNK